MNGSEIEQSATTVGFVAAADSVAVLDKEEPPGSHYQSSLSYDNLPLFQPLSGGTHGIAPAAELADASPKRKRGTDAQPSPPVKRARLNLQTRAFRRAFYPDVKDADWNDWRWQSRHRIRKL